MGRRRSAKRHPAVRGGSRSRPRHVPLASRQDLTRQFIQALMQEPARQSDSFLSHVARIASGRRGRRSSSLHGVRRKNKLKSLRWLLQCSGNCIADVVNILQDIQHASEDGTLRSVGGASGTHIRPVPPSEDAALPGDDVNVYEVVDDAGQCVAKIIHSPGRKSASLPRLDSALRGVLGASGAPFRWNLELGSRLQPMLSDAKDDSEPPFLLRTPLLGSARGKSWTCVGAERKEDQFTQTSDAESVHPPQPLHDETTSSPRQEKSAQRKRPLEPSPSDISHNDKKMKMNNEAERNSDSSKQAYPLPKSHSEKLHVDSNDGDPKENSDSENEEIDCTISPLISPLPSEAATRKASRIPRIVNNNKTGTSLYSLIRRRYSEPVKSSVFQKSTQTSKVNLNERQSPVQHNQSTPKLPLRSKSQKDTPGRKCSETVPGPTKSTSKSKSPSAGRNTSSIFSKPQQYTPFRVSIHAKPTVHKDPNLTSLSQNSAKTRLVNRAKSCNPVLKGQTVVSVYPQLPITSKSMVQKQYPNKVSREQPVTSATSSKVSSAKKFAKSPRQASPSPLRSAGTSATNSVAMMSKTSNSPSNAEEPCSAMVASTTSGKSKKPSSRNSRYSGNSRNSKKSQNSQNSRNSQKSRRAQKYAECALSNLITVVTPPTITPGVPSNVKRPCRSGSFESLLQVPRIRSLIKSISDHNRSETKYSTVFEFATQGSRPPIHASPSMAPSGATYTIRSNTSLARSNPEPSATLDNNITTTKKEPSEEHSSTSSNASDPPSVVYRPANTSDERLLINAGLYPTSSQDTDLDVITSHILPHGEDSRRDNDDTYTLDDRSILAEIRARRMAMQPNGQPRAELHPTKISLRDLVASILRPGCGDGGQLARRRPDPSDQELLHSPPAPRSRLRRTFSGPLPRSAPCRFDEVELRGPPPRQGLRTDPQDLQPGDWQHNACPIRSAPFEDSASEQIPDTSTAMAYRDINGASRESDCPGAFQETIDTADREIAPGSRPSQCGCWCPRPFHCTGHALCRCVMHRRMLCQRGPENNYRSRGSARDNPPCCARHPQCATAPLPDGRRPLSQMKGAADRKVSPRPQNARGSSNWICLTKKGYCPAQGCTCFRVACDADGFGHRSVPLFRGQRGKNIRNPQRGRSKTKCKIHCPDCLLEEERASQNGQPWAVGYSKSNHSLPVHNAGDCGRQHGALNTSLPPYSRQTQRSFVGSSETQYPSSTVSHSENQNSSSQQVSTPSNPGAFGDRTPWYMQDVPESTVPVPGRQRVIVRGPYSTWRCPISRLVKKGPPIPEELPKPEIYNPLRPEIPMEKDSPPLRNDSKENLIFSAATPFIFHGSKFYTNTPSRRNNGLQDDCKFFGYEWPFCDNDQWDQFRNGVVKPKHTKNT